MTIDKTMAGDGVQSIAGPLPPGLRVSLLDAAGRALTISKTPMTIGRKNADLVINDPTVSTLHAVLERTPAGFTIADKGSTNGTFVNGTRVTCEAVTNLDEIRFGEARFTFNLVEDRFGLHHDTAPSDVNQTLLIASAPTVAPIPAGKTYLLNVETGGAAHTVRLGLRITTVGRSDGDVNVDDQTLSRKHFQIEVHPDRMAVKDLGSANGTHVDGKPISYAVLAPGQLFSAGRTRFRIDVKE